MKTAKPLIALIGAVLWSAPAFGATNIECFSHLQANGVAEIKYGHNFELDNGRLTDSTGSLVDYSAVKIAATSAKFLNGFSDAHVKSDSDATKISADAMTFEVVSPLTSQADANFSLTLGIGQPMSGIGIELLTKSGQVAGKVDRFSQKVDFFSNNPIPNTYDVVAKWPTLPSDLFTGPFRVVIFVDHKFTGDIQFNFATVDFAAKLGKQDKKLKAAKNVVVDKATGELHGFSSCKLP